jgi:hypothetical protein
MDLCEFLIGEGFLSNSEADRIRRQAVQSGCTQIREVLELGVIDGLELISRLAHSTGDPIITPTKDMVDDEVLRVVPQDLAVRYLILPLRFSSVDDTAADEMLTLEIATGDPFACRELEGAVGHPIDVRLADPETLEQLIEKSYSAVVTRVMSRTTPAAAPSFESPAASASAADLEPSTARPLEPIDTLEAVSADPLPDTGSTGDPAEDRESAVKGSSRQTVKFFEPSTVPSHNVEDEVSPSVRIQALVNVLVKKGLMDRDSYVREIRRLMEEWEG